MTAKQRKEMERKTIAHTKAVESEFRNPLARLLPRGDLVKFHSITSIPARLEAAIAYEYAGRLFDTVLEDWLRLLSEGHRAPNTFERDFLGSLFADKPEFEHMVQITQQEAGK